MLDLRAHMLTLTSNGALSSPLLGGLLITTSSQASADTKSLGHQLGRSHGEVNGQELLSAALQTPGTSLTRDDWVFSQRE